MNCWQQQKSSTSANLHQLPTVMAGGKGRLVCRMQAARWRDSTARALWRRGPTKPASNLAITRKWLVELFFPTYGFPVPSAAHM